MSDDSVPSYSNFAGFYHWPPIWLTSGEEAAVASDGQNGSELLRMSLTCGVKLRVSTTGVFVFDFSGWSPGAAATSAEWQDAVIARMRFMNLLLACFYSEVFRKSRRTMEKMFIDYGTYAFARTLDLNPFHFGCDSRQACVIQHNENEHSSRRPWHYVISQESLKAALDLTDSALNDESNDAATLAELILHAFHLHDSGKYEASLVSAWTVAERCLNQIWSSHLDDAERKHTAELGGSDRKFINADRRTKLTGRDFTTSIVSEVLSLNGLLSFEQYKLTCDVRQTRNAWLHKCHAIGRSDSGAAINLARLMLQRANILDIDIPFHVIGSVPIALV
jgi:hypothetical protein